MKKSYTNGLLHWDITFSQALFKWEEVQAEAIYRELEFYLENGKRRKNSGVT